MHVLILILQVCIGSIRDAQAHLHSGHQDIRTEFSSITAVEATTAPSTTAQHSPYPLSLTRHSPASSAPCKNPARYDFIRHSAVLSWAQRRQLSPSAFTDHAHHTLEYIDKLQPLSQDHTRHWSGLVVSFGKKKTQ
jgi:hypothetical protein